MKSFLLFVAFLVCVNARPEPPVGYNYPIPAGGPVTITNPVVSIGGQSQVVHEGPKVVQTGPAQVHKHVYVHVAPEEPEDVHQKVNIPLAPPQKHYKIIFIKAPAPPASSAPIIPVQPQTEEKTLVYVLVKKPESPEDIVIPTQPPAKINKPEVFFIKYKTNKETVKVNEGHSAGPVLAPGSGDSYSYSGNLAPSSGVSSSYGPPNKK